MKILEFYKKKYIKKHIKTLYNQWLIIKKNKKESFKIKKCFYTNLLEHSRPITLELILLKEEVNNLEKVLKILQSPIKTTLFLSLAYYKTI